MYRNDLRAILSRARTKPDGIWVCNSMLYRVRQGRCTHIANGGDILARPAGFQLVKIDSYATPDEARAKLLAIDESCIG